ncbi:MAG: type II toxin-antitoxin system RelE/ParE family toxin [Cyanobacteria bacterium J06639_1]
MEPLRIREYVKANGVNPYRMWLQTLDLKVRARVQARITRFESGNLGDRKFVGRGVWEARFTFGSGYRVYFGLDGQEIVLLLLGGDKRSQTKDIANAQLYWADYCERG